MLELAELKYFLDLALEFDFQKLHERDFFDFKYQICPFFQNIFKISFYSFKFSNLTEEPCFYHKHK